MDVIIFGGQSNMQGQTEALPAQNDPIAGACEYRLQTDELIPLRHPVGEDIRVPLECYLLGADQGHGNLVPAFCKAYIQATGREVCAVHIARGATTVAEWQRGTQRYAHAVGKIKCACQKVGKVDRLIYVWLQGESDAVLGTTEEEYFSRLLAYKNDLKRDTGIEKFAIIKVGYFFSEVGWAQKQATKEERIKRDEAIMFAQERVADFDKDFVILTRACTRLSRDKAYINPYAEGHYNNEAMEIIGVEAGKALAELI